jgi:hypothetical protein
MCYESNTIQEIKYKINSVEGMPFSQINLIFSGRQLKNGYSLKSYSIKNKSKLHMVITG